MRLQRVGCKIPCHQMGWVGAWVLKKNCIFAYLTLSNFLKLDNTDFIHDN